MMARSRDENDNAKDENWNSDTPSGEDALITEERSLDIGESGQFAPGGYYNQQSGNRPSTRPMEEDDDAMSPGRH
jgi:hypothetical protein